MKNEESILDVIQNKKLNITEKPFRHIVVDDFFKNDFYNALCEVFRDKLERGLSETQTRSMFARFPHYDAYSITVPPDGGYPTDLFYSLEWKELMSGIFGVETSDEVSTNFHHHKVNSTDGFVHNDFNLASFIKDRLPNGLRASTGQCIYTDDTWYKQPHTIKRMRAIVIIYYLFNSPWQKGDGGETGIYLNRNPQNLAAKIAPINNRLFAFEISPRSFHGFLQNKKWERNTLIQWFHQKPGYAFSRFNAWRPVTWNEKNPSTMDKMIWTYWRLSHEARVPTIE